jgi:hypothetical protein
MKQLFFLSALVASMGLYAQVEVNTDNFIAPLDRPYILHYAIDTTLPTYSPNGSTGLMIDISTPFEVEHSGPKCIWDLSREVFGPPSVYGPKYSETDTFFIYRHINPDDVPIEAESKCLGCINEAVFVKLTQKVNYEFYSFKEEDYQLFGGVSFINNKYIGGRYPQIKGIGLPYRYGRYIHDSFDTLSSKSLPGAKEFLTRRDFYGVDGEGELILPYGRVKGAIKLTDATIDVVTRVYDNGNITVDTQDVYGVYQWYHPEISGGIPIVEAYHKHLYYQAQHTRPLRQYNLYMLKEESIKDELIALEKKQLSQDEFAVSASLLRLYPNPAEHSLSWVYEGSDIPKSLRVFDLHGCLWFELELLANNSTGILDLQTLPAGVYVLELKGDAFLQKQRFIKQ